MRGRVVVDDRRHAVVRADRQELRLELIAPADVDRDRAVRHGQLLQHDRDLPAVRRRTIVDVDHAASPLPRPMTPAAARSAISALPYPASASTSAVLKPSTGAPAKRSTGVSENRAAGRAWRSRPARSCSYSMTMPFSTICG